MRKLLRESTITLLASVIAAASCVTVLASDDFDPKPPIKVYIDGKLQSFPDQKPIIENDRVLTPMRVIFEALEMDVDWNDETKTVVASKGDVAIRFVINEPAIVRNGDSVQLDVAPKILNDRTLVPLRAIAESFEGSRVDWADATRSVYIISPERLLEASKTGGYFDKPNANSYANPIGESIIGKELGNLIKDTVGNPSEKLAGESTSNPTNASEEILDKPEIDERYLTYVGKTYGALSKECGGVLTNIAIQDVPVTFFNDGTQAFFRNDMDSGYSFGESFASLPDNYISTDIVTSATQFFSSENVSYDNIKTAYAGFSALPALPNDYDASGAPLYTSSLKYEGYLILVNFTDKIADLVTVTAI
ncbi:MAG: copper amine oxidase N-terminal domain-containing protein [Clostridiales bacterium]|jgi:hypothetical protein|nr:copper amine oxidase N-terminal domain-containing protein [Clostridiales bacterium]